MIQIFRVFIEITSVIAGDEVMGVQLEISYGLRSALIQATPPEAVPAMAAFSEAVRAAIGAVGHEGMADAQELARR